MARQWTFSDGQRQRIGIGEVFYNNAELLVMLCDGRTAGCNGMQFGQY
jgi:ABC-type oligopeptide transport system ATPase subunit